MIWNGVFWNAEIWLIVSSRSSSKLRNEHRWDLLAPRKIFIGMFVAVSGRVASPFELSCFSFNL